MPAKKTHPNIKALLDGIDALPEYDRQDSDAKDFDASFPQFSKFLNNVRDEVIRDRLDGFVRSESLATEASPMDKGRSENSPLSKLLDADLRATANAQHEFLKLREMFMNSKDERKLDRQEINEKIVETYIKDVHPEWAQNKKDYRESRGTPKNLADYEKEEELRLYQEVIAQEMTGIAPDKAPKIKTGWLGSRHGEYQIEKKEVTIADPASSSTPVHEYIHHMEVEGGDRHSGTEKFPDLKGTKNLAQQIVDGNNYHISQKLKAQPEFGVGKSGGLYEGQPPGESAFYFERLKELAKEGRMSPPGIIEKEKPATDQAQATLKSEGAPMDDVDSIVEETLGAQPGSAQAVAQTAVAGPSVDDILAEVESDPTLPGNDMMNPEGGNALSFATKLKLSLVGGDKLSQEKTLKAEYGEENVMPAPDGEGFVVKEMGSWKKADSTIMSDIAATSPEVLMGMAGSAAGAVLGAMTPVPGGAYMGWVAGGSATSALATVIKNYGAKKIGIKTEYDADMALDTFQKELTWNLAFDSVLGGAGKLVKGALNRGMAKGGAKVLAPAIQAFEGGDKEFASQAFESLVSGTKREDWRTVLRSNDDKLAVKEDMDKIYKWERTPEHIRTPVNPASEQLANVTTSALAGAKKMAFDQHEQVLKKIESTGAMDRPNISLARQAAGFRTELANLGLLGKDSKTGKDILKKRASDDDSGIMQVFDAKSLNTLGKVFGQLNSVLETSVDGKSVERTLSFKEAKQMLNGIDDILESSGYYKNGEAAISNNARRSLVGLRRGINESVVKSLEGVQVEGRDASKMFAEANAKYSNFRSLYDDFAVPSALGGSDQKVVQTVERMFSDSNDVQKADFVKMLKQTVGPKARLTVNRIEQLKAARNLSEVYTSANKGIGAAIKSKMGMNPYDMANALADQAVLSGKIAHAKLTPVSAVKQSAVEGWARGLDFANKLTSDKKQLLLGNPVLMREFLMSVTGVPGEMQETSDMMLGGPQ